MKKANFRRRFLRSLIPKGLFSLTRAVLLAALVLLSTQQLLFLRSQDIQEDGNPRSLSGLETGVRYIAGRRNILRAVSQSVQAPRNESEVKQIHGRKESSSSVSSTLVPGQAGSVDLDSSHRLIPDSGIPSQQANGNREETVSRVSSVVNRLSRAKMEGPEGLTAETKVEASSSIPLVEASSRSLLPSGQAWHRATLDLKECFANAHAYLAMAQEMGGDDGLAERSKVEMERCLLLLDSVSSKGEELGKADAAAMVAGREDEGKSGRKLQSERKRRGDLNAPLARLKSKLEVAERQTRSVILQSMLYSQMAAKAVPQGLHCLTLRLTAAWNEREETMKRMRRNQRGRRRKAEGARELLEEDLEAVETAEEGWRDGDLTVDEQEGGWREDNSLNHYALFSDNVLAVAVVVNSTAQHLREPKRHAFHIVTDRLNLGAMRAWFALNPPKGGMNLEVRCLDELPWLKPTFVPVLQQLENSALREYYFRPAAPGLLSSDHPSSSASLHAGTDSSIADGSSTSSSDIKLQQQQLLLQHQRQLLPASRREDYLDLKYRNPKYLSILNHIRFYLPLIFPRLHKMLFLDDDVVVQRDLAPMWQIPMDGAVNLAVETCGKTWHRFRTYLNFSSPLLSGFDPEACGWAFGMNMFDLQAWRRGNYTDKYHYWQQQNANRSLWRLGTLPPGLLAFYNATKAMDKSWHVLGLGSKSTVDAEAIAKAAVIHYNGHAKPWTELAIPMYQHLWTQYVPYEDSMLRQCNISPP